MQSTGVDIYGGRDPRSVPVYGLAETAKYLGIPVSTLRSWTLGQRYRSSQGDARFFEPVLRIADPDSRLLSFLNVCEAHVCDALRGDHGIALQRIRKAIRVLGELFPSSAHPLIDHELVTSGVDLFVNRLGELINLTAGGQTAMRDCLELYLRRVEFDQQGVASKLFPFTWTSPKPDTPKVVVLDPRVLFGRPAIVNTRIATSVVYERWAAGESSQTLARDYDLSVDKIEEALRCEHARQAA
ncbi:MAG: DUF433 domain-containing protein [Candidatus Eiseniibacteriota bacterium]